MTGLTFFPTTQHKNSSTAFYIILIWKKTKLRLGCNFKFQWQPSKILSTEGVGSTCGVGRTAPAETCRSWAAGKHLFQSFFQRNSAEKGVHELWKWCSLLGRHSSWQVTGYQVPWRAVYDCSQDWDLNEQLSICRASSPSRFQASLPVKHASIICRPKDKDNQSVLYVWEETLQVPHKTKMVKLAHTLYHLGGRTFQLWRQLTSKDCWLFFPNPPVHHSISGRKCLYKTMFISTLVPFTFKHMASPVGARCEELCFKVKELSENFIFLLSCISGAELWSPSYHHCPGSKALPALFRLPDTWSRNRDWMGFRKA